MEYKLRDLLSYDKPSFIKSLTWNNYVKTGDREAHWRLNRDKTLLSGVLITVSGTSMMNAILDLMKNPHPLTILDFYQISGGLLGLLLAYIIVHIIDRAEELRQLRRMEEENQLREMIHEEIHTEFVNNEQHRRDDKEPTSSK